MRARFAPPRIVIDDDVAWLLRAAFADRPGDNSHPGASPRALQLARRTELSGRVAKRFGLTSDTARLSALNRELLADYHNNLAVEALLAHAQARIATLAAQLGVPLIALKFAALRLSNVIIPGTRVTGDLDLLVPQSVAKEFWRALLDAGFSRTRTRAYPHQLEALADPYGAVVELHLHLPGVFVDGRLATAPSLISRQLAFAGAGPIWLPDYGLLAAHAIAHALVQNRATPQSYSPLRMIADLQDLQRAQPNAVALAKSYLSPALRPICDALASLCDFLGGGVFTGPDFEGTSAQTLLWHCIAAREDERYAERLRSQGLLNKLREGSSSVEIAHFVVGALFPSEAELDALYGPAGNGLARVWRRSRRPLDLTTRVVRRWLASRQR
jgi:Uncharacterised nucleotidyltransferase